jgi:hypothetical protein
MSLLAKADKLREEQELVAVAKAKANANAAAAKVAANAKAVLNAKTALNARRVAVANQQEKERQYMKSLALKKMAEANAAEKKARYNQAKRYQESDGLRGTIEAVENVIDRLDHESLQHIQGAIKYIPESVMITPYTEVVKKGFFSKTIVKPKSFDQERQEKFIRLVREILQINLMKDSNNDISMKTTLKSLFTTILEAPDSFDLFLCALIPKIEANGIDLGLPQLECIPQTGGSRKNRKSSKSSKSRKSRKQRKTRSNRR